jgi:vitamin B12 transporter
MRAAHYCLAVLVTCSSVVLPAVAADDSSGVGLDAIVVTATRTEQPRALTGESISVITAAELAAAQTLVVADALQTTPGLTVVRNGGLGQPASIGLRGAASGQTLVLIDGVRLNDPSAPDGAVVLADLLVSNLERIEVLRGPQSTLYGSDAIGGVVNLLSQRGAATPLDLTTTAEGGSLATYRGNIAARGTDGSLQYGAAVNYLRSASISAADARNGNREADAYRNFGSTGNVRWQISDALSVDARGYYLESRVQFDGYPPPNYTFQDTAEYGTNRLLAAYLGSNVTLAEGRLHNRIAVMRTQSDRNLYDPSLALPLDFFAHGVSQRLEYQGVLDVRTTDQLSFGAETLRTTLNTGSPSVFDPAPVPTTGDTRINSYYLQYQMSIAQQLTVTGGLRRDENRGFGSHNSIKLSAAWQLPGELTLLRGNIGDGFKAPSLYDRYSPYSNPLRELSPESARGWELGVDQRLLAGLARVSATYFVRNTHDQIDFFSCYGIASAACSVRPYGYYDNIAQSRAHGVELEAALQWAKTLSLTGNVTRLTAVDRTTGLALARRPRVMASLRADWTPAAAWTLGLGARYTGRRYDDSSQSVALPGYAVIDVDFTRSLTRQLELYGRVENSLAKQYEPVAGYGAPGRTFALGLRLSP